MKRFLGLLSATLMFGAWACKTPGGGNAGAGSEVRSITGEAEGGKRVYATKSAAAQASPEVAVEEFTCGDVVPDTLEKVRAGCAVTGTSTWGAIDDALKAGGFEKDAVRTLVFSALARQDGAPQPFAAGALADILKVVYKVFHPDKQPTEAELLASLLGAETPAPATNGTAPDLTGRRFFNILNCFYPEQLYHANMGVDIGLSFDKDITKLCAVEILFTTQTSAFVYISRFTSFEGPSYQKTATASMEVKFVTNESFTDKETGTTKTWPKFTVKIKSPDGKLFEKSTISKDEDMELYVFDEAVDRLRVDAYDYEESAPRSGSGVSAGRFISASFQCSDIHDFECRRYKQADGKSCKEAHPDPKDPSTQCTVNDTPPASSGPVPCSKPMPQFFEGGECCADGFWHANEGNGTGACKGIGPAKCKGNGQFGVCKGAGSVAMPQFFEGGDCCADGCWHSNESNGTGACKGIGGGSGSGGGGAGTKFGDCRDPMPQFFEGGDCCVPSKFANTCAQGKWFGREGGIPNRKGSGCPSGWLFFPQGSCP